MVSTDKDNVIIQDKCLQHILLEHRVPLQCSYLDIDILIIHQSQCFSLIRLIPEQLISKYYIKLVLTWP